MGFWAGHFGWDVRVSWGVGGDWLWWFAKDIFTLGCMI